MRLYNIFYVCKSCLPALGEAQVKEVKNGNSLTGYQVTAWGDCKTALTELHSVSCLKFYAKNTYEAMSPFEREQTAPVLSVETGRKFSNELRNLINATKTIIRLYESLDLGESTAGIDVKIPKCGSLKEYMDYLKDIDFIFTQCPYLLPGDEEIKFNNVDVGSQWLAFFVIAEGTNRILNNLANLVQKALGIKSNILVYKQQEEQIKEMQLKNQMGEEILDVYKQFKQKVLSDCVSEIEGDLGELKDGDERGKVEKSLEKLVLLMDKGVEIYSSIETPNEIKALFPMKEDNPILPDNIIKLLEGKVMNNEI